MKNRKVKSSALYLDDSSIVIIRLSSQSFNFLAGSNPLPDKVADRSHSHAVDGREAPDDSI